MAICHGNSHELEDMRALHVAAAAPMSSIALSVYRQLYRSLAHRTAMITPVTKWKVLNERMKLTTWYCGARVAKARLDESTCAVI